MGIELILLARSKAPDSRAWRRTAGGFEPAFCQRASDARALCVPYSQLSARVGLKSSAEFAFSFMLDKTVKCR